MLTGIDRGNAVKILCPTYVDGMALVFPKGSRMKGWDEVSAFIESSKQPVKVGYHSPTSAPRMVIEGALRQAGLTVTQDFSQQDADVLLVDLKSTSNLIPALVSKQVDCWVGPAPYPEVAEIKGVGHIGLDLRNLPPQGQWHNFPCCVMAGTERMLAKHPEVVQALVQLMTKSVAWCNEHPAKVAQIMAKERVRVYRRPVWMWKINIAAHDCWVGTTKPRTYPISGTRDLTSGPKNRYGLPRIFFATLAIGSGKCLPGA
mgnify:FL=1